MYPTIYHALLDLTGIDLPLLAFLNSFGFFVAIAFILANWTLTLELRRKQGLGLLRPSTRTETIGLPASRSELIWQGVLGFIVGWKGLYLFTNLTEVTAAPPAYLISLKGNFFGGIAMAALLVWLRWREREKTKLPEPVTRTVPMQASDHGNNITLTAALWGLIGAKLFHWLENPDEFVRFVQHPTVDGMTSGLTMYGGLILAGTAVIRYFTKHGIPPWHGADAAAPGVMLAYAVGRIGCQVSGDGDWGIVNTAPAPGWLPQWLWAYDYPNNVNSVGVPLLDGRPCFPGYCTVLPETVFPTPLYETMMCLVLFGILWALRKQVKHAGTIFFLFLFCNGLERFFIEKIRVNVEVLGSWTQAEIIAVLLMFSGVAGMLWLRTKKLPTNGPQETH